MKVFDDPAEFQLHNAKLRADGRQIGLFATLGAIHKGHLSLVDRAIAENDVVVASVFVNPGHFPTIELADAYPSDLEGDLEKLESRGVTATLAPKRELMYPPNYTTKVIMPSFDGLFESSRNPVLVSGIATVCAKLYALVLPHRWYFGEKDVEQIALVRQLGADLNWATEIIGCPALRDADGLPFSSRNTLLDAAGRNAALAVTDIIRAVKAAFDDGQRDSATLSDIGTVAMKERVGSEKEYIEIVDPITMRTQSTADENSMIVIAVTVPPTRILDSFRLSSPLPRELTDPVSI